MAFTSVTLNRSSPSGGRGTRKTLTLVGPSSYSNANGETITPAQAGCSGFLDAGPVTVVFKDAAHKMLFAHVALSGVNLVVRFAWGDNANVMNGPGVQVPDATDLSGYTGVIEPLCNGR